MAQNNCFFIDVVYLPSLCVVLWTLCYVYVFVVHVQVNTCCEAEGSATVRLGVRDFEIHWISHGFWISDWISGFLDLKVDFRISKWISGFQSGFLDFKVDF